MNHVSIAGGRTDSSSYPVALRSCVLSAYTVSRTVILSEEDLYSQMKAISAD